MFLRTFEEELGRLDIDTIDSGYVMHKWSGYDSLCVSFIGLVLVLYVYSRLVWSSRDYVRMHTSLLSDRLLYLSQKSFQNFRNKS